MKRHFLFRYLPSVCLLLSAFCLAALGQNYSIDWYKVSGGGGTISGGSYTLTSTIGQQDAVAPMTVNGFGNSSYSLTGGFLAIYAVQTPGAPLLTITYNNNQAVVSWPLSVTGWTLQTNRNLASTNWGNYLGAIVNNRITNAPPKGNLFFRLKQ